MLWVGWNVSGITECLYNKYKKEFAFSRKFLTNGCVEAIQNRIIIYRKRIDGVGVSEGPEFSKSYLTICIPSGHSEKICIEFIISFSLM